MSTATTTRSPSTADSRPAGRQSRELLVFRAATLLGLLHALDDAVLHRQPGVAVGQHLIGLAVAVGVTGMAVATFPFVRAGVRAGVALVLGAFTLVNGGTHVSHVVAAGPSASDLSGVLAAAAGAVLVAMGVSIPWRHRRDRSPWTRRSLLRSAIAVGLGVLLLVGLVAPVGTALLQTHQPRHDVGEPPSPAYGTVSFRSSDGLRLAGWYAPSRNGAAIVLVHGGGSDRTGSVAHAELLHRHGYGVLVYDARGSGDSEGSTNGLGWDWPRDVSGALAYLRRRPDVDPARVGGLGLSTGAAVLLEVAATDERLTAVVADGAAARSYADRLPSGGVDVRAPYLWSMYAAAGLFSGSSPGRPLDELVPRIAPTPLLLIAGGEAPYEPEFNLHFARAYEGAGHGSMTLWIAPGVHHTAGIRERPIAYESRVVDFFDGTLLRAAAWS
jgi:uncharacterized protein